ncbi:hypothetical protein ACLX1H_003353 [Fusarium chlamydosporum]
MSSNSVDAFAQVHPDLVDLIIRLDLLPTDETTGFSETNLARTILLALELADTDEQAQLVSRIITEEEMAAERLRCPLVQDTSHRIFLDRAETKAAFMKNSWESEPPCNGKECIVCFEDAHVQAPCDCNYCLSCYREALRIGLRCLEEFPPKCCQPFDEAAVALARSPAIVHIFRQLQEEAEAPIHDRLYCHDGNCATFIPPDRKGACLLCPARTCVECGALAHDGEPCAEGDMEEDVWATMDEAHVVNCPKCGRMVQLLDACNHLTCPCGQEFCYICGRKYCYIRGGMIPDVECHCPQYGGYDAMVPMRDRPGVKPPQFRRRRRRVGLPTEVGDDMTGPLKIPQLHPNPGEEDRAARSTPIVSRVIRPMVLPQHEEALQERRREEERRLEIELWQREEELERQQRRQRPERHPRRVRNPARNPPALRRDPPQDMPLPNLQDNGMIGLVGDDLDLMHFFGFPRQRPLADEERQHAGHDELTIAFDHHAANVAIAAANEAIAEAELARAHHRVIVEDLARRMEAGMVIITKVTIITMFTMFTIIIPIFTIMVTIIITMSSTVIITVTNVVTIIVTTVTIIITGATATPLKKVDSSLG